MVYPKPWGWRWHQRYIEAELEYGRQGFIYNVCTINSMNRCTLRCYTSIRSISWTIKCFTNQDNRCCGLVVWLHVVVEPRVSPGSIPGSATFLFVASPLLTRRRCLDPNREAFLSTIIPCSAVWHFWSQNPSTGIDATETWLNLIRNLSHHY